MTLRSFSVLLSACLALTACDDSEETPGGAGTTSGGDESGTSDTPTNITVTASATVTDSASATATAGSSTTEATDGSTTDPTVADTGSSTGELGSSEGSGEGSGSSTGGDSSTGGMAGVTVYDVQDGTIGEDQEVAIEGVVITAIAPGIGVFVQEVDGGQFSGVYVDTGDTVLDAFAIGDLVDLSGVTTENPGSTSLGELTTIVADSFVAAGGTMKLSPESVDLADLSDPVSAEPWEGVLVTTSGTLVATTFGASFGQFGEFQVVDGEDAVLVDNFLYNIFAKENAGDFEGFGEGSTFTDVSGVLNFSFGNHKIAPRSAAEYAGFTPAG